ncbi:MAG: aminotransferase class III-fold pyridoxal phosphate-dependent enzyme, partial [Desulfosalsimonadaceae bacterium]|nr:aminotransferase class III-fold pyridoxal phosphate-dependent enzyme [Desulfosalsimonadaceae bacterium]
GFCRTGPMFVTGEMGVKVDFLTMAKGIAGGFPFGGFAMSEKVAKQLEFGDHGGTYCGNPLGCAVAHAVIKYLLDHQISENVDKMGRISLDRMGEWKQRYPDAIRDVRGKGLLLLVEFAESEIAARVADESLSMGLFVRQTQGSGIRVFPALNITEPELAEGLAVMQAAIEAVAG